MDIFGNINLGELSVVGLAIVSLVAIVVSILRLGKTITENDKVRDESQSAISREQLKILATQQSEFSKLNGLIADVLQRNSDQFEKAASSYGQLANVLAALQTSLSNNEMETRREFNLILSHLQANEKIMLEMSQVVADINKTISASKEDNRKCYVELKASVDGRLLEIQNDITALIQKQKEKERAENVQKELDDLFGAI